MQHQVLVLDKSWTPHEWITRDEAIMCEAKGQVLDHLGDDLITYRGGDNSVTKSQSELMTASIIVIKGESTVKRVKPSALTNSSLFQRDRYMCAYCSGLFTSHDLTRDHIMPVSKGGPDVWMNVVTACKACNNLKGDLLPGKPLPHGQYSPQGTRTMDPLYLPYIPCKAEAMIMRNRNIQADQMAFLLGRIANKDRSRVYRDLAPKFITS
jgi:5-methylcytosine-specific restriction endonuclease McrA